MNSVMADNASDGLVAGMDSPTHNTVRLAGSVVTRNGIGVDAGISGFNKVFSYGDNEINGNGTDVKGTLTPLSETLKRLLARPIASPENPLKTARAIGGSPDRTTFGAL